MASPNFNASNSTFSNAGGNITNVTYITPVEGASPTSAPLCFNDAPVDLLTFHFTGREEELILIRDSLQAILGDVPIRCIIHGMRGVGKSQLTLQFAKKAFDEHRYLLVFWMSATTIEKLNQGFAKLLDLVGHPDRSHPVQITRLTVARRWLEEFDGGNWLLVLDDVERETIGFLREHLPRKNRRGNILFTTRTEPVAEALANVAGQRHRIFELRIPAVRDAASLLLNHIEEEDAGNAENTKKAEDVVKCVGCLPLAVAQAGLFIKQSGKSLDEMLDLYRSKYKIEIIQWENDLSSYHEKSVAATFSSQLEDLELRFPDVSNFLVTLSFLDPDSIPVDMIVKGAGAFPRGRSPSYPTSPSRSQTTPAERLLRLIQSPVGLQNAIAQVQNRSLVKYQCTAKISTMHIHTLIQFMIQVHASRGGIEEQWFDFAAKIVCGAFQLVKDPSMSESWSRCETLIPHIQSLTLWGESHEIEKMSLLRANERVAGYFHVRKRYDEEESLLLRLVAWKEKSFGLDHDETLQSVHELGRVYYSQRHYIEAEIRFKRVRSIWEDRHGADHPKTLDILSSLAAVWDSQGRYSDAGVLHDRVLASREGLYGPNNIATLTAIVNLANSYKLQGRYSDAAARFRTVLKILEKKLGADDPSTLSTMSGLAEALCLQEELDEAQQLYEKVCASQEEQLGADHPDTLSTMKNLAAVYLSQGSFGEAMSLYNRILLNWERQFGTQHPDTLTIATELAAVIDSQGWFDEAEELYEHILGNLERQLGQDHPETLKTMNRLAGVYDSLGRHRDAETLYHRVLVSREKLLGWEHPSTLMTANNLAGMYEALGRYDESEAMFKRVLTVSENTLGASHPQTLATINSLANVYRAQGRYDESEATFKRVLAASENALGGSHPQTLATMNSLASVYRAQGRHEEADEMSRRALASTGTDS